MIRLRIMPAALDLNVQPGESVLAAARREGLAWRSVCGGHAQCRTCYFTTQDAEAFAPPEPLEAAALALLAPTLDAHGAARLACQAKPIAAATLAKAGVRRAQPPAS